jgi:hypothetical protein
MPRDVCALGLNVLPLAMLRNAPIVDTDLVEQAIEELGND